MTFLKILLTGLCGSIFHAVPDIVKINLNVILKMKITNKYSSQGKSVLEY